MPRLKSASTKTSSKSKAKSHAKPKSPAKTKKTKVHAKPKTHTKPKAHAKIKATTKLKSISAFDFDDQQTNDLLVLIEHIVSLHKRKPGGLKSFYGIDRILDKYNQHYTHPAEKLEAIIKYGMEKDPAVIHQHFFVVLDNRSKDENDLYKILANVGHGKIKFEDAKNKMLAMMTK